VKLRHTTISIPAERVWLEGELAHAPDVRGLAVLLRPSVGQAGQPTEAHLVAALHEAGFATLGIDLLTQYEATRDPDAAYNVPQMANRILAVSEWISHQPPLARLGVGLISSGTASGAAVRAAWKAPKQFSAIVCRDGRPDLAGAAPLKALTTPIRFIAGSASHGLDMLRLAFDHLTGDRNWQLLDGVDTAHMPLDAQEQFAQWATEWLALKLPQPRAIEAETTDAGASDDADQPAEDTVSESATDSPDEPRQGSASSS
jgi:hypothetical protein